MDVLLKRVVDFVAERVIPAEPAFAAHAADPAARWTVPPRLEALKAEAKAAGLWNLFLPDATHGGLRFRLERLEPRRHRPARRRIRRVRRERRLRRNHPLRDEVDDPFQ